MALGAGREGSGPSRYYVTFASQVLSSRESRGWESTSDFSCLGDLEPAELHLLPNVECSQPLLLRSSASVVRSCLSIVDGNNTHACGGPPCVSCSPSGSVHFSSAVFSLDQTHFVDLSSCLLTCACLSHSALGPWL